MGPRSLDISLLKIKHLLQLIATEGVTFHACSNAMRANKIVKEQLPKDVVVVSAGVLDLIELQAEGYAYIKP